MLTFSPLFYVQRATGADLLRHLDFYKLSSGYNYLKFFRTTVLLSSVWLLEEGLLRTRFAFYRIGNIDSIYTLYAFWPASVPYSADQCVKVKGIRSIFLLINGISLDYDWKDRKGAKIRRQKSLKSSVTRLRYQRLRFAGAEQKRPRCWYQQSDFY